MDHEDSFCCTNAPFGRGKKVSPHGAMERSECVAESRLDLAVQQRRLGGSCCIIVRCVVVDPRAFWRFSEAGCLLQLAGAAGICAVVARKLAVAARVRSLQTQSCGGLGHVGPLFVGGRVERPRPRKLHGATTSNIFAASVRRIWCENVALSWSMGLFWDSS